MISPFKGRREDARLLTGLGSYTADWNRPDQVYAAFLRADRAHALIRSIDTAAAQGSPGVLAVLTGADAVAAGFDRGSAMMPVKGRGEALRVPARPALATDRVRFVGEPVALVVAATAHQAQDGVERIAVEYEMLPVVADAAGALAPGAPVIHDAVPGNLCFDFDYGDEAATDAAFASAAHVVRLTLTSRRVVGNPMEPKAALASWDGDMLDLWTSTQGMTAMRDSFAAQSRVAAGARANSRQGCRRRLWHSRAGVSGAYGGGAGGSGNRSAGEMGCQPRRDLLLRLSWPGTGADRRAGGGRGWHGSWRCGTSGWPIRARIRSPPAR